MIIYAYSIQLRTGEYKVILTPDYFDSGLDFLKAKLKEEYTRLKGLGYLDSELFDNFVITKNEY